MERRLEFSGEIRYNSIESCYPLLVSRLGSTAHTASPPHSLNRLS